MSLAADGACCGSCSALPSNSCSSSRVSFDVEGKSLYRGESNDTEDISGVLVECGCDLRVDSLVLVSRSVSICVDGLVGHCGAAASRLMRSRLNRGDAWRMPLYATRSLRMKTSLHYSTRRRADELTMTLCIWLLYESSIYIEAALFISDQHGEYKYESYI